MSFLMSWKKTQQRKNFSGPGSRARTGLCRPAIEIAEPGRAKETRPQNRPYPNPKL